MERASGAGPSTGDQAMTESVAAQRRCSARSPPLRRARPAFVLALSSASARPRCLSFERSGYGAHSQRAPSSVPHGRHRARAWDGVSGRACGVPGPLEGPRALRPCRHSTAPVRVSSAVGRFEAARRVAGRLRRQRHAPTGAGRGRHGLGDRRRRARRRARTQVRVELRASAGGRACSCGEAY